jgi:hypothetical protein
MRALRAGRFIRATLEQQTPSWTRREWLRFAGARATPADGVQSCAQVRVGSRMGFTTMRTLRVERSARIEGYGAG